MLIEKLKIELLRLKRMQFGSSSEARDTKIAQLKLTLEEHEASETQIATDVPMSRASATPSVERVALGYQGSTCSNAQ